MQTADAVTAFSSPHVEDTFNHSGGVLREETTTATGKMVQSHHGAATVSGE